MIQFKPLSLRQALIMTHDLIVTAVAVLLSFYIRFEELGLASRFGGLLTVLPPFLLYAGLVYYCFGLHEAKWRFTSLPEFSAIFRAATVLAISLLILDYVLLTPGLFGTFFFGKITILLYWGLQIAFLCGTRVAYRYFRYTRTQKKVRQTNPLPTLVLGRAAEAEVLLRAIESGAVHKIGPVGILSPSPADQGMSIRGVPVLGGIEDLEPVIASLRGQNISVARLVMAQSAFAPEAQPEALMMRAHRLGLVVSRLPSLEDGSETAVRALRLAPVNVEDLLLRPSVTIDYKRLEAFIAGGSVVVTGGGGSIGAEICRRVVAFKAARLLIIENSEPALHAIMESLSADKSCTIVEGRIADIRDRDRVFRLLETFKPDIVFHAAALKHVPLLEQDPTEGIKTNIIGSVNVADATVATGARAMVMISTDKAIEPVSVLGATKRFAEMYCQALDADLTARCEGKPATRLIAVRFGNVLASNGSVVPKFKAQIEAGGPVTVTHPSMVRYFMTIREACDLVVTASSHALGTERSQVSVYVLNMGQPVRIVELAERMIRLAGLEPGRDIDITFVGMRPGERLDEILFAREEPICDIGVEGIVAAEPIRPSLNQVRSLLVDLEEAISSRDRDIVHTALRRAVPDFVGTGKPAEKPEPLAPAPSVSTVP